MISYFPELATQIKIILVMCVVTLLLQHSPMRTSFYMSNGHAVRISNSAKGNTIKGVIGQII